jgi:membrane protease YdiL (CAAX protease family)
MQIYRGTLRRHPGCAIFLVLLTTFLAGDAIRRNAAGKTAVYFAAIGLSVLAVDSFVWRRPIRSLPLPVRAPGLETLVSVSAAVLAFGSLWLLFVLHYRPSSLPAAVVVIGAGLGSAFGITLALFLLARGYRPPDLGVRTAGLSRALPVILVFASLALTFNRSIVLGAFESRRALTASLAGMPVAGLSEEFLRVVWQTRVGASCKNPAVGWIVGTLVWAAIHGPRFWNTNGLVHGTIGVIDIIPIGLLFGYITHRTNSFLPAALVHGTNIWLLNDL